MSITINGITRRNLQEQVGYNAEQIEKIFSVLDGLNVQDNTIVVDDISETLSAEEIEIARMPVAFMVYNGNLYLKKSETASEAKFDIVFTIAGSTTITFSTSEITVTLANGALGISNTTYGTYSATQIDTLVNAKADTTYVDTELAKCAKLTGADFTGAVKALTLEQTQANYAKEINQNSNVGGTLSKIYGRFEVINNILWIVYNYKLVSDGTAINNGTLVSYGANSLSADIASKIVDFTGHTVAESTSSATITIDEANISKGAAFNSSIYRGKLVITNRADANDLGIYLYAVENIPVNASDELYITARTALTTL